MFEELGVIKADDVKLAESIGRREANAGGGPTKRKRGYHRALKRGEPWAIMKKTQDHLMAALDYDLLHGPNKWWEQFKP